jgi:hypothetical protein
MKLRIASLVIALGLCAGAASAQSIGIYWDPAGATCATTQGSPAPGVMYVLATLQGAAAAGATGAEFSVNNLPSGWFFTPSPNAAANVNLIHPLGIGAGTNIAFPGCQGGSGGILLLYTINYFATTNVVNHRMRILPHIAPSNPQFVCPLLVLCDAPTFTKICVSGGEGVINGGDCTVGVEQKSWSQVKSLY